MFWIVPIVLLCLKPCVSTVSEEVALTRRLTENYIKSARPVLRDSTAINLTLDIAFNQLLDIDEQQQTMLAAIWLRVSWVDEYLRWNKTENGVKSIVLSPDQLWLPDLTLINNAHDEVQSLPIDKLVIVKANGHVTWLQPAIVKSQCTLNSLYFPFDVQTCPLNFGSWVYNAEQVNLFSKDETGDSSEFVPNGAWELKNFPVIRESRKYNCCEGTFTTLTYYAVLRRLSLYFVFHLYLPCILFSFLSLMVFYLPCESGEKTSFSVTMLLALTVFMLVASEYLPPSSKNIPIIAQYFTGTIALLSLCLGATCVTLHIHHRGDYGAPPPNWLSRLAFHYLAKPLCLSIFSTREKDNEYSLSKSPDFAEPRVTIYPPKTNGNMHEMEHTERSFRANQSPTSQSNLFDAKENDNANESQPQDSNSDSPSGYAELTASMKNTYFRSEHSALVKAEWAKIATVLDRAFLIIFFIAAVVLTAYTFGRYATDENNLDLTASAGNSSIISNDS